MPVWSWARPASGIVATNVGGLGSRNCQMLGPAGMKEPGGVSPALAATVGVIVMYNSAPPPPPGVAICAIVANPPKQSTLSMFVNVVPVQYSLAIRSAGAAATPTGPAPKFG